MSRVGGNFDFLETLFLWSPLCRLFLERRLSQFKVGCHHQSTTFTIGAEVRCVCGDGAVAVARSWNGAGAEDTLTSSLAVLTSTFHLVNYRHSLYFLDLKIFKLKLYSDNDYTSINLTYSCL